MTAIDRLKSIIAKSACRASPRAWLSLRIARHDRYFEREFWLIPALCDPRKTSVDVGANMGEFAYFMARHSRDVIAFEVNAELRPALQRLLGLSVRIETVALSNRPGNAVLRLVNDNTGVATIEPLNNLTMIEDATSIRRVAVPLRTLDSFGLDAVGFVKIDVEGHEEAVIEGAIDTLRRNRPALLVESEARHNPGAPVRLADQLASLGFLGFFLRRGRLTPVTAITAAERDPRNLSLSDVPYVNNYIFIPAERTDLIERLRRLATGER